MALGFILADEMTLQAHALTMLLHFATLGLGRI
jgi:hypothetical protein